MINFEYIYFKKLINLYIFVLFFKFLILKFHLLNFYFNLNILNYLFLNLEFEILINALFQI
jgi:hypothetical protein